MKYQTDYSGHIYRDGCLLCELVTIAEERAGWSLSRNQFLTLVECLHEISTTYDLSIPVLSDEKDKMKAGSFVWDHARVANEALVMLGYSEYRLIYTGRIYMPWEEKRGKISFGDRVPSDEIILQILTPNGGHFRGPNHDPWKPGTKMVDLKSLRYYRWVKQ